MIDLELERKAFNDWHFLTYSEFVNWRDDAPASWIHNDRWKGWISSAESKQAEIEALKAQQKLNKPARIGGTVFRKGVAWETVIECAQRHYDYGQRDTQSTPLISPSDAIKLASGELVLVPKEPTEAMIKHAYGTYEGATILPHSFYKTMIEAAQENSHE
ncbi:hypothetical protein [uncultured Acinetobacter sp.]|uniref:hypothetical protein n=1 Tax=uncultured Acinetobacter sp. TaxID=165433 RepID=UPI002582B87E|nr:hypothetical protein [uncultured Acinetobacter sp.]